MMNKTTSSYNTVQQPSDAKKALRITLKQHDILPKIIVFVLFTMVSG